VEYFHDEKNRIQADIAYRLGWIAHQYSTLNLPESKNYSSTLDICILQNLLTNCVELIKAMSEKELKNILFKRRISHEPFWSLVIDDIRQNTFQEEPPTVRDILWHLRNSLSHPTPVDLSSSYPSTGFTTIPNKTDIISTYAFVVSPDTIKNRPKYYKTEEKALEALDKVKDGSFPKSVSIGRSVSGEYSFFREGKPFARIFQINLTPAKLHVLVLELSNYLAQPIQEKWDGYTITSLIA